MNEFAPPHRDLDKSSMENILKFMISANRRFGEVTKHRFESNPQITSYIDLQPSEYDGRNLITQFSENDILHLASYIFDAMISVALEDIETAPCETIASLIYARLLICDRLDAERAKNLSGKLNNLFQGEMSPKLSSDS